MSSSRPQTRARPAPATLCTTARSPDRTCSATGTGTGGTLQRGAVPGVPCTSVPGHSSTEVRLSFSLLPGCAMSYSPSNSSMRRSLPWFYLPRARVAPCPPKAGHPRRYVVRHTAHPPRVLNAGPPVAPSSRSHRRTHAREHRPGPCRPPPACTGRNQSTRTRTLDSCRGGRVRRQMGRPEPHPEPHWL